MKEQKHKLVSQARFFHLDPEIADLPREKKQYSLKDLIDLKVTLTNKSNDITNKLCSVKKATVKQLDEAFVKLKAVKYNLITVKQVIARANALMDNNLDIYYKQEMEGLRITSERMRGKHKAKKDKPVRDSINERYNKLMSDINGVLPVLEEFNKTIVELELIAYET